MRGGDDGGARRTCVHGDLVGFEALLSWILCAIGLWIMDRLCKVISPFFLKRAAVHGRR